MLIMFHTSVAWELPFRKSISFQRPQQVRLSRQFSGAYLLFFVTAFLVFHLVASQDGSISGISEISDFPIPTETQRTQVRNYLKRVIQRRQTNADCKRTLSATVQPQSLVSLNFPKKYPPSAQCEWVIIGEPKTRVVLHIHSLDIESEESCTYDHLKIYSGVKKSTPVLEKLCGTFKDYTVNTNATKVLLEFVSDSNLETNGFNISYYTESTGGCIPWINSGEGEVSSPGYPNNYPDNLNCFTLITSPPGTIISLTFSGIELEVDDNCTYDYVEILDGALKDAPSLGRFCFQRERSPPFVKSSNNSLLVNFHSDHLLNYKGFRAFFKSTSLVSDPKDVGGCSWKEGDTGGTLTSPNYPHDYPPESNCTFRLMTESKNVISLQIDDIVLETDELCSFDKLEIRDGSSVDSPIIQTLCGSNGVGKIFTSTGNHMTIVFLSDQLASFSGFKANYKIHLPGEENLNFDEVDGEEGVKDDEPSSQCQDSNLFKEFPVDVSIMQDESYILRCSAIHVNSWITWQKDGFKLNTFNPIPGLFMISEDILWIKQMTADLEGRYTCSAELKEKTACVEAHVTMDNKQTGNCGIAFNKVPPDILLSEGEQAVFECSTLDSTAKISWEKNGLPLQKSDNVDIKLERFVFIVLINQQNSGVYTCIGTDQKSGCQKRKSFLVTVRRKADLTAVCGRPIKQSSKKKPQIDHGKIVGGNTSVRGANPWQALLWHPDRGPSFCGGTLISDKWVMTAAHCLKDDNLAYQSMQVRLGKYNQNLYEKEYEVRKEIKEVVKHPDFNLRTLDNDIALLRLSTPVNFTNFILPACLGTREFVEKTFFAERKYSGVVTGWGQLREKGPQPAILQEIRLPMVDDDKCIRSTDYTITPNMFCAGYAEEITGDACKGDSGGPFVVQHENTWYIVGVVSWGEGCARAGKYGVYTRVYRFDQWIKSIMGG